MSPNPENDLPIQPTTVDQQMEAQSSVPNSARKPLTVRQTLTSKLRAERGNKLYYKTKLEELSKQTTFSRDSSVSKESLKSVDQFKIPLTSSVFKTPFQKPETKLASTTIKSRARMNLTSVFKTPAKVGNQNMSVKSTSKTNNKILEAKSVRVNLPKEIKNKTIIEAKPAKSNIPKDIKNTTVSGVKFVKVSLPKIQKENKNTTIDSKKPDIKIIQNERQSITAKYKNKTIKHNNVQLKPIQNGVSKSTVFLQNKNFVSKNIESAKKMSNRTDPTKKPVQYAAGTNNFIKPQITHKITDKDPKPKKNTFEKKKVTLQSPIRKSLTAMHFKRVSNRDRTNTIHRAQSLANFTTNQNTAFEKETITDEYDDIIVFKTPSVAKRRSIALLTPMTSKKSLCSPFPNDRESCPLDLRRRLSLWLEKKGKPLGSYHHLRCFGVHSLAVQVNEENKENIEVKEDLSSSYKDLSIDAKESGETTAQNLDPLLIANAALLDLQKLIQDGYPRDQCEAWLDVIRNKYGELEEQPEYWECRAALEETWGNFTTAVDCYKKAIIKGAEVRDVDECLENLLEKFSVLNITPTKTATCSERKAKIAVEAKNVFKSSIISFAIQERSKKSVSVTEDNVQPSKFVATPVRRSTRPSRSGYVSTPGVTICPTLKELDSPIRQSLGFRSNKALH